VTTPDDAALERGGVRIEPVPNGSGNCIAHEDKSATVISASAVYVMVRAIRNVERLKDEEIADYKRWLLECEGERDHLRAAAIERDKEIGRLSLTLASVHDRADSAYSRVGDDAHTEFHRALYTIREHTRAAIGPKGASDG
jgi:hypothetical protein